MANWILALGGSDHDASSALVLDGDIRVAIEQERLTRRKHGTSFWYENPVLSAIKYCLSAEGISVADIAAIVASDTLPSRVRHDYRSLPFREYGHHLCHAASAYMMLPHGSKAGVIVYDGFGSALGNAEGEPFRKRRETFSFFIFNTDGYECLGTTCGLGFHETDEFPIGVTDSMGMLYEMITASLGYDVMDSGKTMGLSSHGRPRFLSVLERFATISEDISQCFRCKTDDPALEDSIARILLEGGGGFTVRADLAASVQALANQTLFHCEHFFQNREIETLCVSGGCALNTVANSFLVENSNLGIPIVIPPHCGDAGLGLGAIWLDEFHRHKRAPILTFRGGPLNPLLSRPGRHYTAEERRIAVQEFYPRLVFDAAIGSAQALANVIALRKLAPGRSEDEVSWLTRAPSQPAKGSIVL
jgi:carbamoyltransferase